MPQRDELSDCPRCAEPLEPGDLFCGVCGTARPAAVSRTDGGPQEPTRPAASAPLPRAVATPGPAGRTSPVPATAPEDSPTLHLHGSPDPVRTPALPDLVVPTVTAWSAPTTASFSGAAGSLAPRGDGSGGCSPDRHPCPPAADLRTPAPEGVGTAPSTGSATDQPSLPRSAEPAPPGAPATPATAPGRVGARCVACGTGSVGPEGYCDHCGHAQPRERDHMEQELHGVAAASDRGRRHHRNEDYFWISAAPLPGGSPAVVAVVCDGVSSATRPDEASATAAQSAGTALLAALAEGTEPPPAMPQALLTAAERVTALATDAERSAQQNAPACTIVSAVVTSKTVTVGWIGDSRAYWVPEPGGGGGSAATEPPVRLTEDDSWATQMVAAGLMSEDEAYADPRAHAITGWLGADAYEVEPHTVTFTPRSGGLVVVCTDGLWNYAESAAELSAALPSDPASRPLRTARHLVGYALDGGGHDNVTVAVMPFPATTGQPGDGAG